MVLGTGSHAGKSTLAAGLCRIFRQAGYRVSPFKAQNMSLNSAAAAGGEIGRAQAVQAAACGLAPTVDMNPILLKPAGPSNCQLVLQGRPRGLRSSAEYGCYGEAIRAAVRESYARLASQSEVMVLEGAGSPAEINLLDRDITNMWMAEEADARCLLVADIERGGAFAALYGTWALAPKQHRIRAFVLNKFRGDAALLGNGPEQLRERTGVPTLGVLPFHDPGLPEEDSLGLPVGGGSGAAAALRIGVVRLPHISNFTDFEPLGREPGVDLSYVWDEDRLASCDVLILPGTKSTMDDLRSLRERGLEPALCHAVAAGKPVLGICGGYQMLGESISDAGHVESTESRADGLGLLPVATVFETEKRVDSVHGCVPRSGIEVDGYLIQHGRVRRHGGEALLELGCEFDGCTVEHVWGTSLHGLFDSPAFRAFALARWRGWAGKPVWPQSEEGEVATLGTRLDKWADCIRGHLDMDAIFEIAGLRHA